MNHSLVYVHGTNGSGKSTLARAVITASGGVKEVRKHNSNYVTFTNNGITLMGKYGNACGGVDGIQPYAEIIDMMLMSAIFPEARVFAEGLVTPGLDTCKKMASFFECHAFVLLDTPVEQCIENVLKRRGRKFNSKPYDPANLYRKDKSARNWADRLEAAGLQVFRLPFEQALALAVNRLALPEPALDDYLL